MTIRTAPFLRARLTALALVFLVASPVAATAGSIRCRATDPSGRRIDGTCRATGPGDAGGSCVTSGGACTISELPPGTYTVTLRTLSGRSSAPRTVRVDDGVSPTVVLTAQETAAVSFEHEGGFVALPALPAGGSDAGTEAGETGDARADAGSSPDAGGSTSGSGGTTSPSDAGTVVAREAGQVEVLALPIAVTTPGTTVAAPPDRSTGTTLALQGRTTDSRGRILDGTVTVTQGGRAIARATTSGGRYQLYDLPSGALTLTFRALSGASIDSSANYAGTALTVNLSVP
ncbi:MAG: hypothetical protein HY905_24945 [Deltaproteobacteria bacterium]|nr:hypothetical protein [Deltaproteobacteria bacterium]